MLYGWPVVLYAVADSPSYSVVRVEVPVNWGIMSVVIVVVGSIGTLLSVNVRPVDVETA
jgi:hypothetical protein